MTDMERRGIPGVIVATEEFVSAAVGQSEALASSPACVFTSHPILVAAHFVHSFSLYPKRRPIGTKLIL